MKANELSYEEALAELETIMQELQQEQVKLNQFRQQAQQNRELDFIDLR